MAFSFTKLNEDNGFEFLLCRIFLICLTFLSGLRGSQWDLYSNEVEDFDGVGEMGEVENHYVYEFKRFLECTVFHRHFQATIHVNYTATTTKLKKDSFPICSCSTLLEIKCSQNLIEFPKFERPRVVEVRKRNEWRRSESLEEDEDNNEAIMFNTEDIIFKVLHVSKQLISSFGLKAFYPLKFNSILANHNKIGDLVHEGALVGQTKSLRELQLGACRLKILPEKLLTGLEALEKLYLWGNNISVFPVGFFKEAINLKELFLWENQIEELESHTLAGLWNLKRLELDKNLISKLDKKHFRHLIALEVLNLSHNRIHTLYGNTFSFMTHLRVLDLENNRIVFMYSEAFNNLHKLSFLNLDGNSINFMPDHLFIPLHNLTSLSLSRNFLDQLKSNTFSGLERLQELKLSSNNLSSLPEKLLKHCSNLRIFLIDKNRLSFLSKSTFPKKIHIKHLSVLSNPIECDCKIQWLKNVCVPKRNDSFHVSTLRQYSFNYIFPVAATCSNKNSEDSTFSSIHNVCLLPKQNCQQHRQHKQLQPFMPQQVNDYFEGKTVY